MNNSEYKQLSYEDLTKEAKKVNIMINMFLERNPNVKDLYIDSDSYDAFNADIARELVCYGYNIQSSFYVNENKETVYYEALINWSNSSLGKRIGYGVIDVIPLFFDTIDISGFSN